MHTHAWCTALKLNDIVKITYYKSTHFISQDVWNYIDCYYLFLITSKLIYLKRLSL